MHAANSVSVSTNRYIKTALINPQLMYWGLRGGWTLGEVEWPGLTSPQRIESGDSTSHINGGHGGDAGAECVKLFSGWR
ncbi:hypothetical protein DMENIID0001_144120 [Sergentomyia squamirostris]